MAGMKLFLTLLGFLVSMKPIQAKDSSVRAIAKHLGTPALLRIVEEAKELVDAAYESTQDRLKEKLRSEKVSPADLLVSFKQPVGKTRLVVQAADYMHVTLALLKEKLQVLIPQDFNITDVLTPGQMQSIYKASGCAKHELKMMDCDDQSPYRTITGDCNNRRIITLGASNRPYARWLLQEYEDGISLPRGWTETKLYSGFPLPLVRAVSNQIVRFNDSQFTEDPFRSVMFMQWGQFIDHDLDFGPSTTATLTFIKGADCANTCVKEPPCFPIKIPPNDPVKNPSDCIAFMRAAPACNGGYAIRNQINALTPFIDASQVYASELTWAQQLRNTTTNLGLLAINQKFTDRGHAYLPFGTPAGFPDICNRTNPALNIPCFFAGDNRVNEMPQLMVLHTLLMREHNRLATDLRRLNPQMDGENIYQEVRKIIGAIIQIITFFEFLPALLGDAFSQDVTNYPGYNDSVDPRVASVFTSAFRFGHTVVRPTVFRLDSRYQLQSETPLEKEFFATWRVIQEGGIDPILRGMLAKPAKLLRQDQIVVDALRDKLFEQVLRAGLDLPSLNMQRGRDHGLPGYNAWRQFCGLSQPRNETELAAVLGNPGLAKKFIQLYGTPDNIDLWIGGVAEPLVPNGRVGPLMACIIRSQFQKTRNGDRFWWENPGVFTPEQREAISKVSLPRIICDNTHIQQVPKLVFRANSYPQDFVSCNEFPRLSLFAWKSICNSAEEQSKNSC
ncbi:eosinophil peroxidase-like isoform X2 [Rhineura floridana]|uniref:eosinophil peroxidase-like isoform X2 n=1 Tax=Rhineura floridana TaxID=261503 RepID=UPI002AC813C3|nr:eosinophil peroxidase-like isoform X2 [Rhineura floridana]